MKTQPRLTAEQVFVQYRQVAYKLAHKYANRFRKPHEDLIDAAESSLAMLAVHWNDETHRHYYRPDKCPPISWVYMIVSWELLDYCNDRRKTPIPFSVLDRTEKGGESINKEKAAQLATKPGWLEGLLRELGEDARTVVQTILFAPAEIVEAIKPTRREKVGSLRWEQTEETVWNFLSDYHGWSERRIALAWAEVEQSL